MDMTESSGMALGQYCHQGMALTQTTISCPQTSTSVLLKFLIFYLKKLNSFIPTNLSQYNPTQHIGLLLAHFSNFPPFPPIYVSSFILYY